MLNIKFVSYFKSLSRIVFLSVLLQSGSSLSAPLEIKTLENIQTKQNLSDTSKPYRLLYFWATWCPDCKEKLTGDLNQLQQNEKLEIITVNTDKDAERAKDFAKKEGITLDIYRDENKDIRKQQKIFSVPHWVLLKQSPSKTWEVVHSEPGSQLDKMKDMIK